VRCLGESDADGGRAPGAQAREEIRTPRRLLQSNRPALTGYGLHRQITAMGHVVCDANERLERFLIPRSCCWPGRRSRWRWPADPFSCAKAPSCWLTAAQASAYQDRPLRNASLRSQRKSVEPNWLGLTGWLAACIGTLFDIVEKEEGEAWAAFRPCGSGFGLASCGSGFGREMRGELLATFSEGHNGVFRRRERRHVTLVYFAE